MEDSVSRQKNILLTPESGLPSPSSPSIKGSFSRSAPKIEGVRSFVSESDSCSAGSRNVTPDTAVEIREPTGVQVTMTSNAVSTSEAVPLQFSVRPRQIGFGETPPPRTCNLDEEEIFTMCGLSAQRPWNGKRSRGRLASSCRS